MNTHSSIAIILRTLFGDFDSNNHHAAVIEVLRIGIEEDYEDKVTNQQR